MMVALEEAAEHDIDETAFSNVKTVSDLERLAAAPASAEPAPEPVDFPSWNRALPFRALRANRATGIPAAAHACVCVDYRRGIAAATKRERGP
jgi:hypothetical protein